MLSLSFSISVMSMPPILECDALIFGHIASSSYYMSAAINIQGIFGHLSWCELVKRVNLTNKRNCMYTCHECHAINSHPPNAHCRSCYNKHKHEIVRAWKEHVMYRAREQFVGRKL